MRSARNIVPSLASVGILVGGSMLVGCDLGPRPIPMESFVVDRVEPAEMRSYPGHRVTAASNRVGVVRA